MTADSPHTLTVFTVVSVHAHGRPVVGALDGQVHTVSGANGQIHSLIMPCYDLDNVVSGYVNSHCETLHRPFLEAFDLLI